MKNRKIKYIIIACAVLLMLFIGYRFMIRRASLNTNGDVSFNEIEYEVVKDDISVSVSGSGSVNPSDKREIKSEIDGTVDKLYVTEGDLIENNEVLVSLKSNSDSNNQIQSKEINLNIEKAQKKLNELYESSGDLTICADSTGIVSGLDIKEGDQIGANNNICTIKETDISYIEAYFTKEQFEKINIGDEASVFMTKYLTTEMGAVSDKDSTPVQFGGGTYGYKITLKIDNPGGYSVGDLAQVTVTNPAGTFVNMSNGEIIGVKENNITSAISGKVKSVNTQNGNQINKGDIIAVLEGEDIELQIAEQKNLIEKYESQLDDLIEGDTIYSPLKGTVLNIEVSENEVVDRTSLLMTIANLDKMEVVLEVDELDISKIKLGQKAGITSDVFKDESITGSVSKISMEGKNQNGVTTYDVTIQLDDRKSLLSGMNVDIEILADNRNDVLVVPIDAIHKINGDYMVTVKDSSGGKSDVKVELGLANKNNVEIKSGIEEGDIVVYNKVQNESANGFSGGIMQPAMGIRGGR